jgi:hypothetical protein
MSKATLSATPIATQVAALPLGLGEKLPMEACQVVKMRKEERWVRVQDPFMRTAVNNSAKQAAMARAGITTCNMAPVYFLPDPYHKAFKARMDMRWYVAYKKPTGGMVFDATNGHLLLRDIVPSSPAADIPAWHTRIRGAWLRKLGTMVVTADSEVINVLSVSRVGGDERYLLMFLHPEVMHGFTRTGVPQINLDQMNPRHM